MGEWDDKRPTSLSDDIGGPACGLIVSLIICIFSAIVGVVGFLLIRIDILNSMLISTMPVLLLSKQGWDWRVYLGMYIATAVIIYLLEYKFVVVRVICSIFGCFIVVFFCYDFRIHDSRNVQLITMGIGLAISIFLNIKFWKE